MLLHCGCSQCVCGHFPIHKQYLCELCKKNSPTTISLRLRVFFQFCYFILIMHMSVLCLPCFLFHDISLWLSLSLTLCCTLQIFFKLNCELVSHSCTKLCRTVIQMVILYYYNIIVIIGKCLFILLDLQYSLLSSFYIFIFPYYVYYVPICQSKFLVSENLLGIKTNSDSHCLHLFSVFFFFFAIVLPE